MENTNNNAGREPGVLKSPAMEAALFPPEAARIAGDGFAQCGDGETRTGRPPAAPRAAAGGELAARVARAGRMSASQ